MKDHVHQVRKILMDENSFGENFSYPAVDTTREIVREISRFQPNEETFFDEVTTRSFVTFVDRKLVLGESIFDFEVQVVVYRFTGR